MPLGQAYHPGNRSFFSAPVILWFLVLTCIGFFLLQRLGMISGFSEKARNTLNDRTIASSASISNMRDELAQIENDLWQMTVTTMAQKIAAYETLLGMQADDPFAGRISARIINRTEGPFAYTYLVNAGSKQGVKLNNVAINPTGLVGRVIGVGEVSARILLVKDFNSRVPIYGAESGARAILYGGNDNVGVARDIPDQKRFLANEDVLTSGTGGVFPRDLRVGVIRRIGDEPHVSLSMSDSDIGYIQILRYSADIGQSMSTIAAPHNSPNPAGTALADQGG